MAYVVQAEESADHAPASKTLTQRKEVDCRRMGERRADEHQNHWRWPDLYGKGAC